MQYTRKQLTNAINDMIAELRARENLLQNLLGRVEPTTTYKVYDNQGTLLTTEFSEWSVERFISKQDKNREDFEIHETTNEEEEVETTEACTFELLKKIIK